MQQASNVVDTLGRLRRNYGLWIILGLMALESGLAPRLYEL